MGYNDDSYILSYILSWRAYDKLSYPGIKLGLGEFLGGFTYRHLYQLTAKAGFNSKVVKEYDTARP